MPITPDIALLVKLEEARNCRLSALQEETARDILTSTEAATSPIEALLDYEFRLRSTTGRWDEVTGKSLKEFRDNCHPRMPLHWGSQIQTKAGRIDFLVAMSGQSGFWIAAVECDGHNFHERTKEQAERDRARDRCLQDEGFLVLRFTGREIWRSAAECADQIEVALSIKDGDALEMLAASHA